MTVRELDIPGFEGYSITSNGEVTSHIGSTPKKLKPDYKIGDGRSRYTLRVDVGRYRKFTAGELVLLTFVGPRPKGLEVCHDDGNCKNDCVENLRWDTHSSNLLDRRGHGTSVCGERHPRAKLTELEVREIRRRRDNGERGCDLAREFGVTQTMIGYISTRKSWTHVK